MSTLSQILLRCSYTHLRTVGTFLQLGLRGSERNRKSSWAHAIAAHLSDPARLETLRSQLGPDAQSACLRLARVRSLPARPFLNEYGGLQWNTAGDRPLLPLEELYRAGLLYGVDHWDPHRADRLFLPQELSSRMAGPPEAALSLPATAEEQTLPPLLHDLTQLLLLFCRNPAVQLHHQRWLPRAAFTHLAQRLVSPLALTGHSTHRQTPYLRNLMFWAATCDLIADGVLTPTGWLWMAQEPALCLRDLWAAWQRPLHEVRTPYEQPDRAWSVALRRSFIDKLPTCDTAMSAATLADQLLQDEQILTADFAANFETISDFDASVSTCLQTTMVDLGVVQPAGKPGYFRRTVLGDWLLNPESQPAPTTTWRERATIHSEPDSSLVITTEPFAPPFAQGVLTLFADGETTAPVSTLGLTARSVARAASHGHGLALLLEALDQYHLTLTHDQITALWHWWQAGRSVTLRYLPVLQTRHRDQLAAITANPATAGTIAQVLGPTTAVWTGDPAEVTTTLEDAGIFPIVQVHANEQGIDQELEALWLAGQVLHLLGDHIPLPLSLPTATTANLAKQMTPARQAVMGQHLDTIRERLQTLLDGLPYLPPPTPSDPEQWTAQLAAAIQTQAILTIRYHSAGRNLETRRRIRPYWEESHRDIRYLRAECIDTGAILTFRLDRIIDLE